MEKDWRSTREWRKMSETESEKQKESLKRNWPAVEKKMELRNASFTHMSSRGPNAGRPLVR